MAAGHLPSSRPLALLLDSSLELLPPLFPPQADNASAAKHINAILNFFINSWIIILNNLASPNHRHASAKIENKFSSLLSSLDEFHATILGATGIGLVVGDGLMRTFTHGTHVEWIAAELFEGLDHSLSTLLREGIVNGI